MLYHHEALPSGSDNSRCVGLPDKPTRASNFPRLLLGSRIQDGRNGLFDLILSASLSSQW
jgi:hypothetical protein